LYYWNSRASTATENYWVNLRKDATGAYNDRTVDAVGSDAGFGAAIPEFMDGRGYLIAYTSGWNPATGSPTTHTFSGELLTGEIPIVVRYQETNSYNLIGNPYASAIDWKSGNWERSMLSGSPGAGYDYWVFNNELGVYGVCNSLDDAGTNGASRYIAPMQGFFISAASGGTLTPTNSVRSHAAQSWLKSGSATMNQLSLTLTSPATRYRDEMIISVNPDRPDGGSRKFWSMYAETPELYTIMAGENYSIRRLPDLNDQTTVIIGIKAGFDGTYTLDIAGCQEFHYAKKIFLEDLKTGAVRELKTDPTYTFEASPGDPAERFRLTFSGPYGQPDLHTSPECQIFATNKTVVVRSLSGKEIRGKISVFNMLGQHLAEFKMSGTEARMQLNATPGCYLVSLITDSGMITKRVLIR
jgi:hypothetical protein